MMSLACRSLHQTTHPDRTTFKVLEAKQTLRHASPAVSQLLPVDAAQVSLFTASMIQHDSLLSSIHTKR